MKLTKAAVACLTLPPGKTDLIVFDDEITGFGLRLRAGGKKTWIVQYRFGAKQRRVTLGDIKKLEPDKARNAAKERLAKVTLGGDPQADKAAARARAAVTLGAVVETYLEARKPALRAKSLDETERYLRKYWKSLHGLPIDEVKRRDVATRLTGIATENGPVAASRARAALSALFAWAMREGAAKENPVIGTNRPAEPRSRERVLATDEITEIWMACRDDDHGRIVKLLMLTGQRRDEVGGMAWPELNLHTATWTIPGERTKNHRTHALPLPQLAIDTLNAVTRREGRDHVFGDGPRREGKRSGGFQGWSRSKATLDARILEARRAAAGKKAKEVKAMVPWTVHDLRRSVATHMADLGVQPHIIEALLNHVSGHKGGVAGVYNRSTYEREVKTALALWTDHVRAVVEGGPRKVVPLHTKAAG